MTYFRYRGKVYTCSYVGSWTTPTEEQYFIRCPECDGFMTTKGICKATNNSGRLNLDPPDFICNKCKLHLIIVDGEAHEYN